jgi:Na+-translocating ferredoxin:NAD+ oxidoreductase RnfG subunit
MEAIKHSLFDRRQIVRNGLAALTAAGLLQPKIALASHYLDPDEARRLIWGDTIFDPRPVTLTKEQANAVARASKTRVLNKTVNSFKDSAANWFIVDKVIGKHEFIDFAIGIDTGGKVKGLEILEYRESYGYEIINPKWRAQFYGRGAPEVLKLDREIKNISGATLSSRHLLEGVNRLTKTWELVLRPL